MAIGGRGVISVASNEAPAEMVQIVELCEQGDFAAARKLHHWLLPLIQVNFVEAQSDPVQGGDGGDGPARRELPPAAGAAVAGARDEDHARAAGPEDARRRGPRLTGSAGAHRPLTRSSAKPSDASVRVSRGSDNNVSPWAVLLLLPTTASHWSADA